MNNCEYIRIQFAAIPQEIIDQYDLEKIQHDGCVYIEIQKDILVLNQAHKIANDRVCTHLKKYGYVPVRHPPALWKHK